MGLWGQANSIDADIENLYYTKWSKSLRIKIDLCDIVLIEYSVGEVLDYPICADFEKSKIEYDVKSLQIRSVNIIIKFGQKY